MKQSFLVKLKEWWVKNSKEPWSCFETNGPTTDGRLEFSMSWNEAFVKQLHRLGYTGGNDEELVQLFYLSTRVLPENLLNGEEMVSPSEMPNLTSEANTFRQ